MSIALVWFRRDLRLADNPALQAALRAGHTPLPVYVHAPDDEAPWQPGAASRSWLHHSLAALDGQLRARGSSLVLATGPALAGLERLVDASGAVAVYWNRLYDPALVRRDGIVKDALRKRGIHVESFAAHLIAEPWTLRNRKDEPYRVFTPFWRTLKSQLPLPEPLPAPASLPPHGVAGCALSELELLPPNDWDQGFYSLRTPGEEGAAEALGSFVDTALENYAAGRDRPDRTGTSQLSPHLHFGEISPRQVCDRLLRNATPTQRELAEPFLREIGWREFSHHLLFHFPHTCEQPLQPGFAYFPWAEVDPAKLAAWQRGRTGIPIIDAGMRELWTGGWMHNRVRMIVASFLTKNLRYHWLHGARWFWDTLVDADLANNTQGWQWTAGCGADAAPYFRIFNPVTQGERFDPLGSYVRQHLPQLAHLSAEHIHQPWAVGGVRGYPKPIVDLKQSREAALAAYSAMRQGP